MTLTELFPIPGPWAGRLTVSARPRGDDWLADEIRSWRKSGVDIVVSLLVPAEAATLGLNEERRICAESGASYSEFPIEDRSVPARGQDVMRLVEAIKTELNRGKGVNIHCRQGIGRSAMIAAALLVDGGLPAADAIQRIGRARRSPVPETPEQSDWIDRFALALSDSTVL